MADQQRQIDALIQMNEAWQKLYARILQTIRDGYELPEDLFVRTVQRVEGEAAIATGGKGPVPFSVFTRLFDYLGHEIDRVYPQSH